MNADMRETEPHSVIGIPELNVEVLSSESKENSKTKIPENPELEREKSEQVLANDKKLYAG